MGFTPIGNVATEKLAISYVHEKLGLTGPYNGE